MPFFLTVELTNNLKMSPLALGTYLDLYLLSFDILYSNILFYWSEYFPPEKQEA